MIYRLLTCFLALVLVGLSSGCGSAPTKETDSSRQEMQERSDRDFRELDERN